MLVLEVESVEKQSGELDSFKVAKIIKAEKHPNADQTKSLRCRYWREKIIKVVCGAPNAKRRFNYNLCSTWCDCSKKSNETSSSKIRGVTSYGMLCSESELNLSDESDGITELP